MAVKRGLSSITPNGDSEHLKTKHEGPICGPIYDNEKGM